jgi:hypothetical protein
MDLYETPKDVAAVLARWVPKTTRIALDPSVGRGALIIPAMRRLKCTSSQAVCVDVSAGAVRKSTASLANVCRTVGRVGSFLTMPRECVLPKGAPGFDLVVMNPPFAGASVNLRKLSRLRGVENSGRCPKSAPIEVLFVLKSVSLLADGGRMVAVLPSSVVSAERANWIRTELLNVGSIRCVHELGPNTFPRVEARFYLLVFDKGSARHSRILLRNHRLIRPDQLPVKESWLDVTRRLDYRYYEAKDMISAIRRMRTGLVWRQVQTVSDVIRGSVSGRSGIHTTEARPVLWRSGLTRRRKSGVKARTGDILAVRVGRKCASSIGMYMAQVSQPLSDCVIRVRPKGRARAVSMMFALRVIAGSRAGQALLEQGTGAAYIPEASLRKLEIPIGLPSLFPLQYRRYRRAVRQGKIAKAVEIESWCRAALSLE